MKELKSSSSRLIRLFKQSRENWKETALERQKKLRALEIMDSTRGELIEQKLCELTDIVGCPIQIIADHGSDLEKGIKLYSSKYP
ncbi:hypothetical protein F8S20_26475, partial [Nostoc sp. BAE]|nr:hypothetical protein [Nostoc commune BAE]